MATPPRKQIEFANRIAKRREESLPPGVQSDAAACSAYIDAYKDAPSKKQSDYARSISDALPAVTKSELRQALADSRLCSAFIWRHEPAFKAREARRELNQLYVVPASLRKTLGRASVDEQREMLRDHLHAGGGFSGVDPATLKSVPEKLIGYWLEGLERSAFEGMGKLPNVLGNDRRGSFKNLEELRKALATQSTEELELGEGARPIRYLIILKLVAKDAAQGQDHAEVLSILPISPVRDAQDERGYRWVLAAERVPRFNREQVGEGARLPGLGLDDVDSFDEWALEQGKAAREGGAGSPIELAEAFALWDQAFDAFSPAGAGRGDGLQGWITRYQRDCANNRQLKRPVPVFCLVDGSAASGAIRNVCAAYRQVLDDAGFLLKQPALALFRGVARLEETPRQTYEPQREGTDTRHIVRYAGHMDTFKNGSHTAFPLDPAQRDALIALATTEPGHLLAVNGPPGTGKTSLLRAVIASTWIEPLLGAHDTPDCPMILACAATKQAVTNIISSFDETPDRCVFNEKDDLREDAAVGLRNRWLPHLTSYGWYAPGGLASPQTQSPPTSSPATKPIETPSAGDPGAKLEHRAEKKDRYGRYQQIRRWGGPNSRWNFDGASRKLDQLTPERAEELYLACASHHFGRAMTLPTALTCLREEVRRNAACLDAARAAVDVWIERLTTRSALRSSYQARRAALQAQLGAAIGSGTRWAQDPATRPPLLFAVLLWVLRWVIHALSLLRTRVREAQLRELDAAALRNDAHARAAVEAAGDALVRILCTTGRPVPAGQPLRQTLQAAIADRDGLDPERLASSQRELIRNLQEWLDQEIRPGLFHLCARYWEGRYVESRKKLSAKLSEDSSFLPPSENQLRELAMLAPVFVVTAYSAPRLMRRHLTMGGDAPPYLFGEADLLIIDEAGQVTPEIGASTFLFAKRAIVVGDVEQLEPVWNLGKAEDRLLVQRFAVSASGTGTEGDADQVLSAAGVLMARGSVMRMAQRATQRSIRKAEEPRLGTQGKRDSKAAAGLTLTNHYRCQAPIIEICNRMVYRGALRVATPKPDKPWRPELERLSYLVVDAGGETKPGSRSNRNEADCIARWIHDNDQSLRCHFDPKGEKDLADIVAVVTPFKDQKDTLRKALKDAYDPTCRDRDDKQALYNRMVIDTVHALQGAERPIVIFSMVESWTPSKAQFYDRGTNLINVAVSRAKEMLIVAMTQHAVDYARGLTDDALRKPSDWLWQAVVQQGTRLNPPHVVMVESPTSLLLM